MTVSRPSKKIDIWKMLPQMCEDQLFHTPGLMSSTWPHALWLNQLIRFSTIVTPSMIVFPSMRMSTFWGTSTSQVLSGEFLSLLTPTPCPAWSTWLTWPSSGSSRWPSRSRPSAGCARRIRCFLAALIALHSAPICGSLGRASRLAILF